MNKPQAEQAEEITLPPDDHDALPEKQEQVLLAQLAHPTHREAALAAGVSAATLWRYMRDEAFARRLREARRGIYSHALQRLQHSAGKAAKVLCDIAEDPNESGSVRTAAAREVLNQTRRALENDDLRTRVEAMERYLLRRREEEALDRARAGEEKQ